MTILADGMLADAVKSSRVGGASPALAGRPLLPLYLCDDSYSGCVGVRQLRKFGRKAGLPDSRVLSGRNHCCLDALVAGFIGILTMATYGSERA